MLTDLSAKNAGLASLSLVTYVRPVATSKKTMPKRTSHDEIREFLSKYRIEERAGQLCQAIGLDPVGDREKRKMVLEAFSHLGLAVALDVEDFGVGP